MLNSKRSRYVDKIPTEGEVLAEKGSKTAPLGSRDLTFYR